MTENYEGVEITPDDWGGLETQVRELETEELLAFYDMMAENPTLFQLVSGELSHRADNDQKLASENEREEIRERGL